MKVLNLWIALADRFELEAVPEDLKLVESYTLTFDHSFGDISLGDLDWDIEHVF